ncbi:MAG: transcriptional repressor [Acutalibacteraceae bacterium]
MSMQKNSKQRDAILAELCLRCDHPTAEQIYFDLKKDYPSLSLATVYRNLKQLEQSNAIVRIPCPEADRFDGKTKLHYHMTCLKCSNIIDIEIENDEEIDNMPKAFGGKITGHSLMFFGYCEKCLKESEQTV